MKLLVPFDGSDCSARAIAHAIKRIRNCAAPDQCQLHILNVQTPVTGSAGMFVSGEDIKEYHREEALKTLAPARVLAEEASINHSLHIDVGRPADVIDRYARDLNVDEIVMGTRGNGNIADLLLGSTSEELLRLTSLPVLLVR